MFTSEEQNKLKGLLPKNYDYQQNLNELFSGKPFQHGINPMNEFLTRAKLGNYTQMRK